MSQDTPRPPWRDEVLAGVTTFLTMAYILVVHPDILSAAGMPKGPLLTVTALASAFATFCMGWFADYPFALAPGMGLNAFFAFSVVLGMKVSWELALTAVFLEGCLFLILTFLKVREAVVDSIPRDLKRAVSAGIGIFIAFLGLKNMGLVVDHPVTFVTVGPTTATVALGFLGLIGTSALMARRTPGAFLWGILLTSGAAWGLGLSPAPEGLVAMPPSPLPLMGKVRFDLLLSSQIVTLFPVVVALFFVDFFDTVGTLVGVAEKAGWTDSEGKLPRLRGALFADALGTTVGALLGTSTVTTFIESASGVEAGGHSGRVAFVVAGLFLLAPFFHPVLGKVPSVATAPVLVLVGMSMLEGLKEIEWGQPETALPAFLTVIGMPLTFSISEGISWGILSYVLLYALTGRAREIPGVLWVLGILFGARMFWELL